MKKINRSHTSKPKANSNLGTFSGKSFSDSGGPRRWQEFKQHFPLTFIKKGYPPLELSADTDLTWLEVRNYFDRPKSANPDKAGLTILKDGKEIQFSSLPRFQKRTPGTVAASFEKLVAFALLTDIRSPEEFDLRFLVNGQYDRPRIKSAVADGNLTESEIDRFLDNMSVNTGVNTGGNATAQAEFFRLANNIRESVFSQIGDPKDYRLMRSDVWDRLRAVATQKYHSEFSEITEKIDKNRVNVGDIVFVRKSARASPFPSANETYSEWSERFNRLFKKNLIVPISLKKTDDAIKGARGVTYRLDRTIKGATEEITKIIKSGKLEKVPIRFVQNSSSKSKGELELKWQVLDWLQKSGISDLQKVFLEAVGKSITTDHWFVSETKIEKHSDRMREVSAELKEIVIPSGSNAVWFIFPRHFALIRDKGTIQLSIEQARKETSVSLRQAKKDPKLSEFLNRFLIVQRE